MLLIIPDNILTLPNMSQNISEFSSNVRNLSKTQLINLVDLLANRLLSHQMPNSELHELLNQVRQPQIPELEKQDNSAAAKKRGTKDDSTFDMSRYFSFSLCPHGSLLQYT